MEVEFLIDSFKDIGYQGTLLDANKLRSAIHGGTKDLDFTTFISFLSNELKNLCSLDEHVNPIKGSEDSVSFLLELSSFLKEIGCPYESLTQGHMSDRLNNDHDKILVVEFLVTELMSARMVAASNPEKTLELKIQETPTASNLKQLLLALKFPKPPANVTPAMLFQKVLPKLQDTVNKAGEDLAGRPLLNGVLTEKQWTELEKIQDELDKDYTIRREMLLKRLDCTIQSFQWSDRMKGKEDKIVQIYHNKRKNLKVDPGINLSDLIAARDDLAVIEKTSNASVRRNTKSDINKVIIGQVPDRGGRPSEQAPPPPEMPSWQQRSTSSFGGGRGGGRGGQSNRGSFDNNSRGGGNFNQQPQNFDNRGFQQQSFDSNRGGNNYSSNNRGGNNYNDSNRGGNNFGDSNRGGNNFGDSNRGGNNYGDSNRAGNNYGDKFGGGNYQANKGAGYNDQSYGRGGNQQGYRNYESFQHNKSNYSEQYVQDSQQNKQYSGRGDRDYDSPRGQRRGGSNYNRGNYR